jgi:hypothetical protein
MQLKHIKQEDMPKKSIEVYNATFDRLLKEASFTQTDLESIEIYKDGLLGGLHVAIIKQNPQPNTLDEWQEAAMEEQLMFFKVQEALGKRVANTQMRV